MGVDKFKNIQYGEIGKKRCSKDPEWRAAASGLAFAPLAVCTWS